MSKQKVFDIVAKHLLTQNAKSLLPKNEDRSPSSGYCAYRAPDGKKCAIGILIPDEVYHSSMEGGSLSELIENYPEFEDFLSDLIPGSGAFEFLSGLQYIHDFDSPSTWKEELKVFAKSHDLVFNE